MTPRRILITGASGFAGRHLVEHCVAEGDEVIASARSREPVDGASLEIVDLLDASATRELVARVRPDAVYHLAALASVAQSWRDPGAALRDNVAITLHLLEAVRDSAPSARVVAVASGELYGPPSQLPVDESAPLRPQNPYAVSKASADLLAGFFADAHGVHVVRARPFNHAGPGQADIYAISSFAKQVAAGVLAGDDPVRVVTGNPDAQRDYTDVRDVVRAYRLLALHASAGIYNVCSGLPAAASTLVERLGAIAGVQIDHVVDPKLVRPHEVMEVRGSHARLTEATGWEPAIPLDRTLADALEWWKAELGGGSTGRDRPSGQ